jgi:hypothetical protein
MDETIEELAFRIQGRLLERQSTVLPDHDAMVEGCGTNSVEAPMSVFKNSTFSWLSNHQEGLLKLYSLLLDVNAPRYLFDDIVIIFKDSFYEDNNMYYQMLEYSQRTFFSLIQKEYPMPRPVSVVIGLEVELGTAHQSTTMWSFPIIDIIHDFLGNDELFGDKSKFVLNPVDPFLPYVSPDGLIEELMDGSVVQSITVPPDTIIMPIVLYTDKATITQNQKIGIEPILMAFGNIRKETQYQNENTRVVAYMFLHLIIDQQPRKHQKESKLGALVKVAETVTSV